jgi:hypothetical protein
MKLLATSLLTGLLTASSLFAFTPSTDDRLAVVYSHDKTDDKAFYDWTKNDLSKIGFYLNDPHHAVNIVYEKNYGKTYLENVSFSSMMAEETVRPLLNIDPRLGGFGLFNLLLYRTKADSVNNIAHLTPTAMLDILEITDEKVRSEFTKAYAPLDAAIEAKYGTKKHYVKRVGTAAKTMMNFEIPIPEDVEDLEEYMDEFQERFDITFVNKGYILAGFYNVKDSYNSDDDVMPDYVTYWTYDLCHIPFSYEIFDGPNAVPVAGVFAPCSMYIYVRESDHKIVIGMPTLNAWAAALGITNKKQLEKFNELDKEIPELIHSLGGVDVPNVNPLLKK